MATPVKVPPKPTQDPDVHLKGSGERKTPRTLKGDVRAFKGKVASARSKWADDRKAANEKKQNVRKEAGKVMAPAKARIAEEKELAAEVVAPVYRTIETVKNGFDPSNKKTRPYVTSFALSSVLSWAIGPQVLVAAYERLRFGTNETDWGILHGPGRWFRDTARMAYETGRMGALIWAIVLGLTPMILLGARNAAARYVAQGSYRGRMADAAVKWLTRLPYLILIGYFVGIGYPDQIAWLFGSPWTLEWWQVYVMGLFCTAYYFTMWAFDRAEKGLGLGYFHVFLMVPAASIVTGALLHNPGAAW